MALFRCGGDSGGGAVTQDYVSSVQTLANSNTFQCGFVPKYVAYIITGNYPTNGTNVYDGAVHNDAVTFGSGTVPMSISSSGAVTITFGYYSAQTHYVQLVAFG